MAEVQGLSPCISTKIFMQVVVNNLLTHYEKQGTGPVVLFLHGWGDSLQTFASLVTLLKKDYSCVTVDLPGFGGTNQPPTAWSVADYAQFVADFIKKIDIKDLQAVVGHSNGGTISLYALAHGLLYAEKLILLASAGIRSEDSFKKGVYKVIAKIGKQVSRLFPKKIQQKLRRTLYTTAGSDILISPELEETFKKVIRYDIQADARKVQQPALLVYAEDDRATPARYGQKLEAAIPNATLTVLPNGGHFIHQTQIEVVAKQVREFLK